jgi:hypothetical protein
MMPKVFISHSWEDKAIARKIAENLRRDEAEVWIDYARIEGGDSLPKVIGQAIQWCDTLILVWSTSAVDSYFVALEWECALTNQKRIIPCIIDEAELPFILTSKLFINFRDFGTGYPALVRALKLQIREKIPEPEITKTEEKVTPKPIKVEPKPSELKESKKEIEEIPKPEIKTPALQEESKKKSSPVEDQRKSIPLKRKFFSSPQIRKKWLQRTAIILTLCVLIVGGVNIIPKMISRESHDYSNQNTIQEDQNEVGLSTDDVKKMLKVNNLFDSSWNSTAPGFDNDFDVQTIEGKKVVIDKNSGLMWQHGGSPGYMTYEKAKEYIDKLNRERFAGFDEWRLPTLEEAMSLMEPEQKNGDLYIDPKFDQTQRYIWTADRYEGQSWAWVVYFDDGIYTTAYSTTADTFEQCVPGNYREVIRSFDYLNDLVI